MDNWQLCTQTEPGGFPAQQPEIDAEEASRLAEIEENLPFPNGMADPDYSVRATDESMPASPTL